VVAIVQALLLATMLAVPLTVAAVAKRRAMAAYWVGGLLLVCALTVFMAYWPDLYRELRIRSLGVDVLGMDDAERLKGVAPAHRDEAARLYRAPSGVGWPLTAALHTVGGVGYYAIVWIGAYVVGRRRGRYVVLPNNSLQADRER
jgi:hypothetical protein